MAPSFASSSCSPLDGVQSAASGQLLSDRETKEIIDHVEKALLESDQFTNSVRANIIESENRDGRDSASQGLAKKPKEPIHFMTHRLVNKSYCRPKAGHVVEAPLSLWPEPVLGGKDTIRTPSGRSTVVWRPNWGSKFEDNSEFVEELVSHVLLYPGHDMSVLNIS
ncbi:MAG: hypothetical protein TREMPRED_000230, partial [Tremellales sp. Tagirdzhanova-0007]